MASRMDMNPHQIRNSMQQIDLGGMSFAEIRERNKYYVDKTGLIADILENDDNRVYLFTRPRRFGKTTNLSMLDAFFNIRYKGNSWFEGLEISEHPEYSGYMNAFPVIHIDLGVADADEYGEFLAGMRKAVRDAFSSHRDLLSWPELSDTVRSLFNIFESETTPLNPDMLESSVSSLSEALAEFHGKPPVILIDEYDRPVSDAFGKESHERMMSFLTKFVYASVKANPNRQMVYITGVMQIAKQSIFSGLNNIVVNNVFSKKSDERFGFTESDVRRILSDFGFSDRFDLAKKWYDGYRFGDAEVYNPYSIMNFVSEDCREYPYWVQSGRDVLVKDLLKSISSENYSNIMELVTGGSMESELVDSFPYETIGKSGEPLYSLMVMSGYLNAVPTGKLGIHGNELFEISIPNEGVKRLVGRMMNSVYPVDVSDFVLFNKALIEKDPAAMERTLARIMSGASYLNLREATYEAVIMTLVHALSSRYRVKVEAPEGQGRVDVLLWPLVRGEPGIVFELKTAGRKKDLNARVDEAFAQIHDRRYCDGMEGRVILVGMAFWKKVPCVRIGSVVNRDGAPITGARCSPISRHRRDPCVRGLARSRSCACRRSWRARRSRRRLCLWRWSRRRIRSPPRPLRRTFLRCPLSLPAEGICEPRWPSLRPRR